MFYAVFDLSSRSDSDLQTFVQQTLCAEKCDVCSHNTKTLLPSTVVLGDLFLIWHSLQVIF